MEFPSPTPRRVTKPGWLDLRLVFGIILIAAAVLVGAIVVQRARHTEKELAVTRDLAVGTTLQSTDLREVDVKLPGSVAAYVRDRRKAVGKVLAAPLSKGELLPAAALGVAPERTTVTIPFPADAAPKLSRGQRIVVWLSSKSCPSLVLLPDVAVQNVSAADPGSFDSGGTGQDVVLSVSPALAERVVTALAIDGATIRAGVLSGAPHAAGSLAPLDSCGTPSGS